MKTHVIELFDPFDGEFVRGGSLKVDGEEIEGKVCGYNFSSCGLYGPGVLNVCRFVEPLDHTQGNIHTYWTAFDVRHCDMHINNAVISEQTQQNAGLAEGGAT